jgi:hypothetical protein
MWFFMLFNVQSDCSRFNFYFENNKNVAASPVTLIQENRKINGRFVKLITTKNESGQLEAHFTGLGYFATIKEFTKRLFQCKSTLVYRSDTCQRILAKRLNIIPVAKAITQTSNEANNTAENNVKDTAVNIEIKIPESNPKNTQTNTRIIAPESTLVNTVKESTLSITTPPDKKTKSIRPLPGETAGKMIKRYESERQKINEKIRIIRKAWSLTLHDFYDLSEDKRNELVEGFKIKDNIGKIEGFYKKLENANNGYLYHIRMSELFVDFEYTYLKYALMNRKEFDAITVRDLEHLYDKKVDSLMFVIDSINGSLKKVSDQIEEDLPADILDLKINNISSLTPKYINENIAKIPAPLFYFLEGEQIEDLDWLKASAQQIRWLISKKNTSVVKEIFSKLPVEKINSIFNELSAEDMNLLSDTQISGLEVALLTKDNLAKLFNEKVSCEENKRRFALISKEKIDAIFDNLDDDQISLFSMEMINDLTSEQIGKFTVNTMKKLFPELPSNDKDYEKVFTEHAQNFWKLKIEVVNGIFGVLHNYGMKLVSKDHALDKKFDVSKFTKKTIFRLFQLEDQNGVCEKNRNAFSLLSIDKVNTLLDKLDGFEIGLLSDDHLKDKNLDVTKITEKSLDYLFSPTDPSDLYKIDKSSSEEYQRRFNLLPIKNAVTILERVEINKRYSLISYDFIDKLEPYEVNIIAELLPGEDKLSFLRLARNSESLIL